MRTRMEETIDQTTKGVPAVFVDTEKQRLIGLLLTGIDLNGGQLQTTKCAPEGRERGERHDVPAGSHQRSDFDSRSVG